VGVWRGLEVIVAVGVGVVGVDESEGVTVGGGIVGDSAIAARI